MLFWARNSGQRRWNLCPHRAYILGENKQIKMENRHYVQWWKETEWGKEGWKNALRWHLQNELKNLREWLCAWLRESIPGHGNSRYPPAEEGRCLLSRKARTAVGWSEVYTTERTGRGYVREERKGLHVQGKLDHYHGYDMYSEWHEAIGRILRKGVTWCNLHLYRIIPVAV